MTLTEIVVGAVLVLIVGAIAIGLGLAREDRGAGPEDPT